MCKRLGVGEHMTNILARAVYVKEIKKIKRRSKFLETKTHEKKVLNRSVKKMKTNKRDLCCSK